MNVYRLAYTGALAGAIILGNALPRVGAQERPEDAVRQFENREFMAQRFSGERGKESFEALGKLIDAHQRLRQSFLHHSNLGDFDPGTNQNPYLFVGHGKAERLPENATVSVSFTREQFIALEMPDWETVDLGGANHRSYLNAWMAYHGYEIARLTLALMNATDDEDSDARERLKSEMDHYREVVVSHLAAPSAD